MGMHDYSPNKLLGEAGAMSGQAQNNPLSPGYGKAPPQSSYLMATIGELSNLHDRLDNIVARLGGLGDRILGPRGTGISNNAEIRGGAVTTAGTVIERMEGEVHRLRHVAEALSSQVERLEAL